MSNIEDLINERNKYIEEVDAEIISALKEDLKALFEKYPDVEYFSTPCYTLSWNDGDPTYYSVYDYMSRMYPVPPCPEGHEDEWNEDVYYEECPRHELFTPLEEYVGLISSIPSDILESKYEEGLIVFHRNGIVKVDSDYHD